MRKIAETQCREPNRHPERAAAEASHDADLAAGAGPGPDEDEPEGTRRESGQPEDGGAGVVRADAGRRAAGRPRPYTRTEEATDEPSPLRIQHAYQMPVRFRERFLPEDRASGPTRALLHSLRRGDQTGSYFRLHGAAADAQTESDAGSEKSISDHHRRGASAQHGDRQMSSRGRSGSQSGPVARHEVGLCPGFAPLLQGVRPVRAVRADR